MAPRLRCAAILLVGAYRDVDVRRETPARRPLANLAREPHCERIELRAARACGGQIDDRVAGGVARAGAGRVRGTDDRWKSVLRS